MSFTQDTKHPTQMLHHSWGHTCFRCCTSNSYRGKECKDEVQCTDYYYYEKHNNALHSGPALQTKEADPISKHGEEAGIIPVPDTTSSHWCLLHSLHRNPATPLTTSENLELNLTSNIDRGNNTFLLSRHMGNSHLKFQCLAWEHCASQDNAGERNKWTLWLSQVVSGGDGKRMCQGMVKEKRQRTAPNNFLGLFRELYFFLMRHWSILAYKHARWRVSWYTVQKPCCLSPPLLFVLFIG